MSVPLEKRNPNPRMLVQEKATALVVYTIRAAGNEKICPKHHRWALGERLIDSALAIARSIDLANSLQLDSDYEERRANQRKALAETYALLTLIHVAREMTHFPMERHAFWVGEIDALQGLIRAWADSDRKRHKAAGKAASGNAEAGIASTVPTSPAAP